MSELIESAEAIYERAYEQAAIGGQPRYKCVRAGIAALEAAGRLLPPGGEVRDQFTVLEIDPEQRTGGMVIHWSLERAEEGKTRFKDDPGGYEGWPYRPGPFGIYRRQARTWGDGSEHYTPWSPVVSDSSAGQDGLPASTDGVAPPAGDEINK